uniref:Pyruvate dehydrogenase E1 component subunit beta n=1 Tax=Arundo donax TaxID=35708 RepID=A0A0A9AE73_ARUDO
MTNIFTKHAHCWIQFHLFYHGLAKRLKKQELMTVGLGGCRAEGRIRLRRNCRTRHQPAGARARPPRRRRHAHAPRRCSSETNTAGDPARDRRESEARECVPWEDVRPAQGVAAGAAACSEDAAAIGRDRALGSRGGEAVAVVLRLRVYKERGGCGLVGVGGLRWRNGGGGGGENEAGGRILEDRRNRER